AVAWFPRPVHRRPPGPARDPTGKKPPCGPVLARRRGKSLPGPTGAATVAPSADAVAHAPLPRHWTEAVVDPKAAPVWPAGATDTSRSCAGQSFQPVSRKSMGIQGGSSVEDHAWETSFGESDLSDHRNASHCGNNTGPKTMTLFLKRGTKYASATSTWMCRFCQRRAWRPLPAGEGGG